jgi:flavin reductase (DIM6/NTAB) family NADH-FMN oxidoreductase RutF
MTRDSGARGEDRFEAVPLRDNFYQSCAFFPMPFALITTTNEHGLTSIGPYALQFPLQVCERYSMLLISRANSNTAVNLRRNGKCALNYIEFDEELLKAVVDLGYPGVTPEQKMRSSPFALTKSPTPRFRDDPDFPLIVEAAFQVFECTVDGEFHYHPARDTDAALAEDFLALTVENILLRASFRRKLEKREEFPDMPLSYGFRGGSQFWFARHERPFHYPIPRGKELELEFVVQVANRLHPGVRFTRDACAVLTSIPAPFLEAALGVFITKALKQGVSVVDLEFVRAANTRWSGSADGAGA